jgi:hypothetical protein
MAGGPAYLGGSKPKSRRRLVIGGLAVVIATLLVLAGLLWLPHLMCSAVAGQAPGCGAPPPTGGASRF